MPDIYIMAIFTIAVTTLLCAAVLNQLTHSNHRYYWWMILGLPLSFIVNRFIKAPAIASLAAWMEIPLKLGPDMPFWFLLLIWLNAPIFEEAIKILPLALPASRGFLEDASRALSVGLALGMGFGLGEAAYLAYGMAHSDAYRQLPWYMFTGFGFERLVITFAHGLFTSLAVLGLHDGRSKAFFGYLTAVGLHALINLGPILLALKLLPSALASMASYIAMLIAFVLFQDQMRLAKKVSGTGREEIVYFEQ